MHGDTEHPSWQYPHGTKSHELQTIVGTLLGSIVGAQLTNVDGGGVGTLVGDSLCPTVGALLGDADGSDVG